MYAGMSIAASKSLPAWLGEADGVGYTLCPDDSVAQFCKVTTVNKMLNKIQMFDICSFINSYTSLFILHLKIGKKCRKTIKVAE